MSSVAPAVVPSRTILLTGMREQWRLFAVAVFASLVYGALTVADAWVLGWVTDNVITPALDQGRLTTAAALSTVALFVGVASVRALGIVGRRLIGGIVYFRLAADYRRRVTRQYLALPLSWHARHPTGQLLSNANADVEATWQVMNPMPMAVGVLAMLVVGVGAMAAADWVLTLVGLVVFPLLFAINVVYQRALSPRVTRAQQLRAQVSEVAHESFAGALVVKTLGREAEETARFRAVTTELRDASISAGRVRSMFDPVLEALPNLGVLLVVVIGVERVLSGAADAGDVVEVAYLFTVIAFPVRAIGWVLGELPRSQVGWARVRAVLDARGAMPYGTQSVPGSGPVRLTLTGVRVAHPDPDAGVDADGAQLRDGEREVLRGVDLDVPAGRTVAVVGLTGSGKSTLATLLVRLLDPDDGAICLDGYPLTELSQEALAGAVALVPQQTFLFDDTVRDNVTLGADISDDNVWAALRTAQADGFVRALPHRLDTHLGERGTTLSGGQRQRLALARALVRRPRLLVLDDATSAVDPEVESRILAALRRPTQPADAGTEERPVAPTVLVIAYRKATISLADEVVLLAGGRVADRGTHVELVQRSATYRDLVDAYDRSRASSDLMTGAPLPGETAGTPR